MTFVRQSRVSGILFSMYRDFIFDVQGFFEKSDKCVVGHTYEMIFQTILVIHNEEERKYIIICDD